MAADPMADRGPRDPGADKATEKKKQTENPANIRSIHPSNEKLAPGLEKEFDAALDKGRDSGEVTCRSTIPRINVDREIDIAGHQVDGRIHSLRTGQFAPAFGIDLPGARRKPP